MTTEPFLCMSRALQKNISLKSNGPIFRLVIIKNVAYHRQTDIQIDRQIDHSNMCTINILCKGLEGNRECVNSSLRLNVRNSYRAA